MQYNEIIELTEDTLDELVDWAKSLRRDEPLSEEGKAKVDLICKKLRAINEAYRKMLFHEACDKDD